MNQFLRDFLPTLLNLRKKAENNFEHPTHLINSDMYWIDLHGVGITALVDTGATATFLKRRPLMRPVESKMVGGNGDDVPTIGVGDIRLSLKL